MSKNIIITGATKGIGKAIVHHFANQGFNIAFCARSQADIRQLGKELSTSFPQIDIIGEKADMSIKKDITHFWNIIQKRWDKIDVLVNNAGVFIPGKIHQEPEGTLETMLQTNLYSAYHMTRACLPSMLSHSKGHIFNICSVAGIQAYPNGGSYSISKFALHGFSKALREELKGNNIRVTSVLPGATYTNSWSETDLPAHRFMKSSDIAQSIYDIYKLSKHTVVEEIILRPQLGDI